MRAYLPAAPILDYALTLIGVYTLATLALGAVRRDDLSVLLDVD